MKNVISKFNEGRLRQWRKGKQITYINPEDIVITDEEHLKAKTISYNGLFNKYISTDKIDKTIVVKPYYSGDSKEPYALVMGIKYLMVAKMLNKPIGCIVVDSEMTNRDLARVIGMYDNDVKVPTETEMILPMNRVIIPPYFMITPPRKWKVDKARKYYEENNCLDKPITVIKRDDRYFLSDQYTRYILMKDLGIRNIPVKFEKN